MAKQLSYQPLPNFGVNGLNTQNNPSTLDSTWLTSADNIVLRESGRISFRKGFKQKVVPTGVAIGSMVEHNDQGTNKIFASHGTSIYTMDFTTPQTAFPSSGDDVKRTVANSTGDWQFVNFNNRLHCFHAGVAPQRYDGSLGSNVKWSSHYSAATAINLANASEISAPAVALAKTYKITALGNTNFYLLGANVEAKIDDIFTSVVAGSEARDALSRPANEMIEGKSYKIIALGDTHFNLNGADNSPNVDEIFTANDVLGIGTGRVVEVITGTTGTIVEIKTNPTLTTITVDSTSGYASTGKILIDDEVISYTGITSTTFTGCTRGSSGTTATYHDNNDAVTTATKPESVTDFDPSCGMGFYGKLWAGGVSEAPDVIFYSVLLDGDDWNGIGSGYIDLKSVWGTDEIVGIAPFFGKLVIFGKNNIVVYDNPYSGGTLSLNEVIKGVGLVSRDTIQAIGDDLVFLSETGLRSLARTTEKDKLPMLDLSQNIKDTLIRNIGTSDKVIKSVYLENEGIYILTFTNKNITYVFDFKHATPQQTPRITTWTFDNDREPASMINTELYSGLLVGQKDGGIAGYEGYYDADMLVGEAAASITAANTSYQPYHSTALSKIGASSILFEHTSSELLATQSKLDIGTGDFTIECWFSNTTGGYQGRTELFNHWTGSDGFAVAVDTNFIYFYGDHKVNYKGTSSACYWNSNAGEWNHIAITRSGSGTGNIQYWANGVERNANNVTPTTWTGDVGESVIGLSGDTNGQYTYRGYMDEIRFSSVARYSSTFTPSTTEFTKDADTLLLIHSDKDVSGSTTFVDSAGLTDTHLNASYSADISSPWILLGQTMASSLLKNMTIVLEGGSGATLALKWYKDFSPLPSATTSINLSPSSTGASSKWGEALYGTSKYTPIYGLKEYRTPLSGSAKHLKLNMSIESNGYNTSIQDLTLLHKEGKIR